MPASPSAHNWTLSSFRDLCCLSSFIKSNVVLNMTQLLAPRNRTLNVGASFDLVFLLTRGGDSCSKPVLSENRKIQSGHRKCRACIKYRSRLLYRSCPDIINKVLSLAFGDESFVCFATLKIIITITPSLIYSWEVQSAKRFFHPLHLGSFVRCVSRNEELFHFSVKRFGHRTAGWDCNWWYLSRQPSSEVWWW